MDLSLQDTGETRHGRPVMELAKPLLYKFDVLSPEIPASFLRLTIRISRGFKTDFASVPRLLWPIISPTGPWRSASVVHDWCCESKVSRPLTDAIFWQIMCEEKRIKVWQRCLIYSTVRVVWLCWGKWRW